MWVLFVKLFSPAPWWLEPKAHRVRPSHTRPRRPLPISPFSGVSGALDRVAAQLILGRCTGAAPPMVFGIMECGVRPRDQ